ncbi:MAG TPA: choice-of-anchor B family protein [Longimicrobiales bacterium]|nr:choice-of-anchor B family protein [Longimicrobiales bacterium]
MRFLPRLIRCLILLALTVTPAAAQSGSFGTSVVIDDGELIVAEPNNWSRPGLVYVYRQSAGGWREAARLEAPGAARADGFGTVLARTGGTLFVAQRGGRIHIFERQGTGWHHAGMLATDGITGADAECNQYGYCGTHFGIALAAAGDWLFVGEPGSVPGEAPPARPNQEPQPQPPGTVHVFRRGADGWSRHGRLQSAASAPGDAFGAAIALANDRALIGAPNQAMPGDSTHERAGRVVEFVLENGAWREAATIAATPQLNATYGTAVALDDDVLVVGAPGADDGRGAAHVYRRDARTGTWSEQARLTVANAQTGDRLGSAVALAGDDVWVGAPAPRGTDIGTTYVYRTGGGDPVRRIQLTDSDTRDGFGDRIAAHAGVIAVTAAGMHHQAGAIQVYERDERGAWTNGTMLVSAPDALPALVGAERQCTDGSVGAFDCSDVDLLAFMPSSMLRAPEHARGVRTNDNWGWTDPETGREYALVGRNDGTSFIDITDPTNPVLIGDLPKTPDTPPSQLWRDIKTYRDHAYIVADGAGNHGMQVFDLRRLRDVTDAPALFEPDVHYTNVASVHNIAINEETGFAYLVGSRGGGQTCGGGLHMIDIREPQSPQFAGCFRDESGTHDVQCVIYRGPDDRYREREICLLSNGNAFAIADVTDKQSPRALSRASSPNAGYIHQGWTTEDDRYFIQDDEADVIQGGAATTRTLVWDLTDLEDPVLAREFMGSMPASAHNLYVKGDVAYQANYRYGLHVLDVSDPENPREIGTFDTTPFLEGPGFSGAWSTYPFFKSGTVIVTSVQEGLFLLKPRPASPVF